MCPGPGVPRAQPFPPPCPFPVSPRPVPNARGGRAALPASHLVSARTRRFSRVRVVLPAPRIFFARLVWPLPLPSGPHARVRSYSQCSVFGTRARSFPPRGLCAPPAPPVAVSGAAGRRRSPARKGVGSPPPPPSSSRGCPQRTIAHPVSAPVLGVGLGRDPRAPFVPVCGGAPVRQFLKHEPTPPGEELPGSKSRGATHVGWNDRTGPRVFRQCSRPGGWPPPKGRPDTQLRGLCVFRKREKWAVGQLPELLIFSVLRHHRRLTSEVTEVRFTLTPRFRAKPQSCILFAET